MGASVTAQERWFSIATSTDIAWPRFGVQPTALAGSSTSLTRKKNWKTRGLRRRSLSCELRSSGFSFSCGEARINFRTNFYSLNKEDRMKSRKFRLSMFLAISMFCSLVAAQQGATTSSATVPRLVNFSGKAADAQGKAIAGIAGVAFAIYKDQYEGAPLWLRSQEI